jgi:hypothetical protein
MKRFIAFLIGVVLGSVVVPLITLAGGGFYVDSSTGFSGIGNTTPAAPLDVSGGMYSRLVTDSDSSSVTVDWNAGNVHVLTLNTASTTLIFSNGHAGGQYDLILNQDTTGERTVDWPASIKWADGNAPLLSSTASSTDTINLVYDGSYYLGTYALNYAVPANNIAFGSAADCGNASSCSVTTSGSNRALVAFVHGEVGTDNTPTCTYGGTSMTLVDKVQTPSDRWMYGFLLINPASGSNTLSCSGPTFIRILAASYTGVQQSGQPDNHTTNSASSATSLSTTYTVNHNNAWIVQNAYASGGTVSGGSGYTARGNNVDSGQIFDSNGPVSSGSNTVAFSDSGSAQLSQIIISLISAH